jgi:bifunctional non-homologous end joining protein LigD
MLKVASCVLDGEVVVCDAKGLATFDRLRYGPRINPQAMFYAFDLLELDGSDLRLHPIEDRKAALVKLVRRKRAGLRIVDHLQLDDGALIFEHACALGCEGIVSKRLGSRYTSGRSRDWIKVKNPLAPAAKRLEEEDWSK